MPRRFPATVRSERYEHPGYFSPTNWDVEASDRAKLRDRSLHDVLAELREAEYQLDVYNLVARMNGSRYMCYKCARISLAALKKQDTMRKTDNGGHVNNNDGGYHHYDVKELEISANLYACKFCMLLWTVLCHDRGVEGIVEMKNSVSRPIRLQVMPTGSLEIYWRKENWSTPLGIVTEHVIGSKESSPIKQRLTALHPLSNECLSVLRSWIDDCTSTHCGCPSNLRSPLPTRVIDVGNANDFEEPYLLTTTSSNSFGAYVTLSHCWGGSVPLQTTKSTLRFRERGIPMHDLPRNFHDAVILTRRLGYRYLWIDSLCIIQDDADDWARESSRMGTVYQNSVLTISAMSAKNSNQGFLIPRDPNATAMCKLKYNGLNSRNDDDSFIVTYPELSHGDDAVGSRAWILQELVLSPRVVHYTFSSRYADRQMIWECQEFSIREDGSIALGYTPKRLLQAVKGTQERKFTDFPYDAKYGEQDTDSEDSWVTKEEFQECESESEEIPDLEQNIQGKETDAGNDQKHDTEDVDDDDITDYSHNYYHQEHNYDEADLSPIRLDDRKPLFHQSWRDAVAMYTVRKLTVASDKLPAISGIAAEMSKGIESSAAFLAGLWNGHELVHDLLWRVAGGPEHRNTTSTSSTAPSWSWASVEGGIHYNHCEGQLGEMHQTPMNRLTGDQVQGSCISYCHAFAADIIEAYVQPENENNPYGSVKTGGYIKVYGKLRQARRLVEHEDVIRNMEYPFIPPDATPTLPQYTFTKEDAEKIWHIVDGIIGNHVQSEKLNDVESSEYIERSEASYNPLITSSGAKSRSSVRAQLVLCFAEALAPFATLPKTTDGLYAQLNRVQSCSEEKSLKRCINALEYARNQAIDYNEYSVEVNHYIQERLDHSIRYHEISTPRTVIELLPWYLMLQNLLTKKEVEAAIQLMAKEEDPVTAKWLGWDLDMTFRSLKRQPRLWQDSVVGRMRFDSYIPDREETIWCLLLTTDCFWGNQYGIFKPHGLVLLKEPTKEGGSESFKPKSFRRIGVFELDDEEEFKPSEWFDNIEKEVVTII